MKGKGLVVLAIMDGYGLRKETEGNAIARARTPNLTTYFHHYPFTELLASGEAVGLPEGFQGSSEVGHWNMGAGRIVKQIEVTIDEAIHNGLFYENKAFLGAIKHAKKYHSRLHIMGLLQDQGVHAHENHLFALLKLARRYDIEPVLHLFTDGRDTLPKSAVKYLRRLQVVTRENPSLIATLSGRYFAMDRDKHYERTRQAYDAIVWGRGRRAETWQEAIKDAYEEGETDEFVTPRVLGGYDGLHDNDALIFFNYRSDRARQLSKALLAPSFEAFPRRKIKHLHFVSMYKYYDKIPCSIAFEDEPLVNTLPELLSRAKLKQLRIAETEKYAHVTYFFNDQKEKPYPGEERIMIPSPRIRTYDKKPSMSAREITTAALKAIRSDEYDVIIMNYANCDMVGHTGNFDATVQAVEVVDECMGLLGDAVLEAQGILLITADHGNAELLVEDGGMVTSHTKNKVPFCVVSEEKYDLLSHGILADIAPTVLDVMHLPQPDEMTARSLIKH